MTEQDFTAFEETLRREGADLFARDAGPIFVARAPGRLDVMGGVADYSGCLVAQFPIGQAAIVAAQRDDGGGAHVRTANAAEAGFLPDVTLPADAFVNPTALLKILREGPPEGRWAGYVAGSLALLRAEGLVPRGAGARFFIASTVPMGAGVASSASVEVAALRALCAAFGVGMDALVLSRLCQRVENEVMDAPCGIMDQMTAALGEAGRLLVLLCQPYLVQDQVALPGGWSVFGIDSGVKHSVSGSNYTRARVAAFMGYKMLADRAGGGFGGYLCNVSPDEYRALFPARLPETMGGAAFLGAHSGIFDSVTTVDPAAEYAVRACAEHAIFEHVRVGRFLDDLRDGSDAALRDAGAQMLAAHASYSDCGLGAPETDLLVELARSEGDAVAGARITGGGSGGTVAVLARSADEGRIAERVASAYAERTGRTPRIIRGTSPGAYGVDVKRRVG